MIWLYLRVYKIGCHGFHYRSNMYSNHRVQKLNSALPPTSQFFAIKKSPAYFA